jgi:hypothetical protein
MPDMKLIPFILLFVVFISCSSDEAPPMLPDAAVLDAMVLPDAAAPDARAQPDAMGLPDAMPADVSPVGAYNLQYVAAEGDCFESGFTQFGTFIVTDFGNGVFTFTSDTPNEVFEEGAFLCDPDGCIITAASSITEAEGVSLFDYSLLIEAEGSVGGEVLLTIVVTTGEICAQIFNVSGLKA